MKERDWWLVPLKILVWVYGVDTYIRPLVKMSLTYLAYMIRDSGPLYP